MIAGRLATSMVLAIVVLMTAVSVSPVDRVTIGQEAMNEKQVSWIGNDQVKCSVIFQNGELVADCQEIQPGWPGLAGDRSHKIKTDADFGIDVQWTGWLAPGKIHNADNPVIITKKNFRLAQMENRENPDGSQRLVFTFKGLDILLEIQLIYQLRPDAFYVKRQMSVRDPKSTDHFLRWLWPQRSIIHGNVSVLKHGGFREPAALTTNNGGAFFGFEYPASKNLLEPVGEDIYVVQLGEI